MRIKAFTVLALLAAVLGGPAHAALTVTEQAIEASTRSISLPASESGVIVAKPCPACAPIVLRMTSATRLVVGKTPVSLAQLQKFVSSGGDRGMVVFYDPRQRTITRISVRGQLPSAARP
jgi:hypothetical protein